MSTERERACYLLGIVANGDGADGKGADAVADADLVRFDVSRETLNAAAADFEAEDR